MSDPKRVPKTGDRVHVEYDATVMLDVTRMPGCLALKPDRAVPSDPTGWVFVAAEHCTVLPPLPRLHEVIPDGAEEPPAGAVVVDDSERAWQRYGDGFWHAADWSMETCYWSGMLVRGPLTLVHLPKI